MDNAATNIIIMLNLSV